MKDFRAIYKDLARAKQVERWHVIQRAILIGMEYGEDAVKVANQIIRSAFTPITSKQKLDNGRQPYDTLIDTFPEAKWDMMRYFDSDEEAKEFQRILAQLTDKYKPAPSSRYYVYTFVRQDISPEYQLVQAAHATARMGYHQGVNAFRPEEFFDLYFTIIGVANEDELAAAIKDCQERGIIVYEFREPDIGNVLTAASTSPIRADLRRGLLRYKLLTFKK